MQYASPERGSRDGNAQRSKEFIWLTYFRHPNLTWRRSRPLLVRRLPKVVVKLDKRIKTALDETRLLILGSQVLFGFLLESFFQNAFETLPRSSQLLVCAALTLMVLSIACLIAPSMQHRIVEAGQSTLRLERATSR